MLDILHISIWYTLVLKEAKERDALKEVKDAIIKGNILETVHILGFSQISDSFDIFWYLIVTNCADMPLIILWRSIAACRSQSRGTWDVGTKRPGSQNC